MGNGNSISERYRSWLEVSTDAFVYASGSRVSGHVRVVLSDGPQHENKLQSLLKKVNLGKQPCINMHVFGAEVTSLTVGDELNETPWLESSCCALLDFTLAIPINSSVRFEDDGCEIPFAFDLPRDLPSSMSFPNTAKCDDDSFCQIRYEIEASLNYTDENDNLIFSAKTRQNKPLRIFSINDNNHHHNNSSSTSSSPSKNSTSNTAIAPIPLPTNVHDLHLLCGYRLGYFSVNGSINTSTIKPGETLHLNIDYSNNSTAQIEGIQVTLSEIITWAVRSTNNPTKRCQSYYEKRSRALVDKWLDPHVFTTEVNDLHARNIPLHVDNTARETYEGKLIQVQHLLSVAVVTSKYMGFCIPDIPCTSIAVRVVSPVEVVSNTTTKNDIATGTSRISSKALAPAQ